ncbi:MAG: hypothetical protein ORN85_07895 [Sediminibacterium sp.]|nr:hypothetical protein [Sediminibacterium sp.]
MKNIFIYCLFIIITFLGCDTEFFKNVGKSVIRYEVILTNKTTDSLDLIFFCNAAFSFKCRPDTITFISNKPQRFKTLISFPSEYRNDLVKYVFSDYSPSASNVYEISSLDSTLLGAFPLFALDSVGFVFNKKKIISFNVNATTNNNKQISHFITADKIYTNYAFMNKLITQNLIFPQKLLDSARNIN